MHVSSSICHSGVALQHFTFKDLSSLVIVGILYTSCMIHTVIQIKQKKNQFIQVQVQNRSRETERQARALAKMKITAIIFCLVNI